MNNPSESWEFIERADAEQAAADDRPRGRIERGRQGSDRIEQLREELVELGGDSDLLDGWSAHKTRSGDSSRWCYIQPGGRRFRSKVEVLATFGIEAGHVAGQSGSKRQRTDDSDGVEDEDDDEEEDDDDGEEKRVVLEAEPCKVLNGYRLETSLNSSGFKGVWKETHGFRYVTRVANKTPRFDTAEEAALARAQYLGLEAGDFREPERAAVKAEVATLQTRMEIDSQGADGVQEVDGLRLYLSSSNSSGYRGVWKEARGLKFMTRVGGRQQAFDTALEAAMAHARHESRYEASAMEGRHEPRLERRREGRNDDERPATLFGERAPAAEAEAAAELAHGPHQAPEKMERLRSALNNAGGSADWLTGWSAVGAWETSTRGNPCMRWSYLDADGKAFGSMRDVLRHFGLSYAALRHPTPGCSPLAGPSWPRGKRHAWRTPARTQPEPST